MERLIGIDLGTTNSCVAVMDGGVCTVIPTETGQRTTPSVVTFMPDGRRLVGEPALRQAAMNPSRTIYSIKREMGSAARVRIDGHSYSPQEISAIILRKLKEDAERFLGEPVTDAVITVPAYFTDAQRQATRDAGVIAGLNVRRIINEPTAAALSYGVDKELPSRIMIYDLGVGTFDVSVLDIRDGVIEVLATAGNNRLGGDDFDKLLAELLLKRIRAEYGVDLSRDPSAYSRICSEAEKAKVALSSLTSVHISIPFLIQTDGKSLYFETDVTREDFESLIRPLIDATLAPVRQVLADSHLTPEEIGKVLLVGGSTRIPAVRRTVRMMMGQEPFVGLNPDESVAKGAALEAGVLDGEVQGLLLLDVTPLTLGIETMGGVFSPIIARNTTIPVKKSAVYTTASNFQSSVEIKVFQGERQMTRGNKLLGNFRLSGIKRALRGVPQIEVTFEIDASGIVHVSARDLATGKEQAIVITASGNLSRGEIERAIADAQVYAREDAARKKTAAVRDSAEAILGRASILSRKQLSRDQRRLLEEGERRLRKALRGKDTERIESNLLKLEAALQTVSAGEETALK